MFIMSARSNMGA